MKIAVLSDWETAGGANIFAQRLTQGFVAAGHQVTRIYQKADTRDARYETRLIPSLFPSAEMPRGKRLALRFLPGDLHQRLHERSAEKALAKVLQSVRPDVINIHNLHIGRWSPEMLRVCADHAPVVCKLCDTWMITGRCYNPGDCTKYLTRCDHTCPTAGEYPALAPSKIGRAYDLRGEILDRYSNIAAVAPSEWLGRMATAGLWKKRVVFTIRNGLDLNCYRPMDRDRARSALGLNSADPVLLCCATQLGNRKKGLPLLIEALSAGLRTRVQLVLMGEPAVLPPMPGVDVHSIGYITQDLQKALAYNAADIYVHPSLADNAPNTVMESLACGTPVIAFGIDGLPEMVIPKKTGWLAKDVSSESLREVLTEALAEAGDGQDLRRSCRDFAEREYSMPAVVESWTRVFQSMLIGDAAVGIDQAGEADVQLASIGSRV